MAKSFYAVKTGRKTGIFLTWPECQEQVVGFQGAVYKGFKKEQDALDYLDGKEVKPKVKKDSKGNEVYIKSVEEELALTAQYSSRKDCIVVYTDGSIITQGENIRYSFGIVFVENSQIVREGNGEGTNAEAAKLQNVAGELAGVMNALLIVKKHYPNRKLIVFHDYEGVSAWINGNWKAKNPLVKKYVEFIQKNESIVPIEFVKVTGHKGNKFNVRADKLARQALGLK